MALFLAATSPANRVSDPVGFARPTSVDRVGSSSSTSLAQEHFYVLVEQCTDETPVRGQRVLLKRTLAPAQRLAVQVAQPTDRACEQEEQRSCAVDAQFVDRIAPDSMLRQELQVAR